MLGQAFKRIFCCSSSKTKKVQHLDIIPSSNINNNHHHRTVLIGNESDRSKIFENSSEKQFNDENIRKFQSKITGISTADRIPSVHDLPDELMIKTQVLEQEEEDLEAIKETSLSFSKNNDNDDNDDDNDEEEEEDNISEISSNIAEPQINSKSALQSLKTFNFYINFDTKKIQSNNNIDEFAVFEHQVKNVQVLRKFFDYN